MHLPSFFFLMSLALLLPSGCKPTRLQQKYIHFSPSMLTSPSTSLCISNFFPFCYIYFLPCLCVPVKMSVGTETEKFWDSLWELQAECTGLFWVERHPWARGDLASISTQREEDRGPNWTQAVRNIPIRMEPERKKEMHTRTNTTTMQ